MKFTRDSMAKITIIYYCGIIHFIGRIFGNDDMFALP